jgi:replicative DNA helicase Mcm
MTNSAIVDRLTEIFSVPKWTQIIDALRPDDTLTIDISNQIFGDVFLENEEDFKELAKQAVLAVKQQKLIGLRVSEVFNRFEIKLVSDDEIQMNKINSTVEGQTIAFTSVVIGAVPPKTFTKYCDAMCPNCYTTVRLKAGFDRKIHTLQCARSSCRGTKMEIQKTNLETEDIQTVVLQQPLEDAVKNSPIAHTAKVVGKQVGSSYVGQRKKVLGIFRSDIDQKKDENDVFIDVISMTDTDDVDEILPTEVEEKEIRVEATQETFVKKLIDSYAPHIYGMEDVKLSCILQLVGGVKSKKRADINILLVGDPSMAKSELLKYGNSVTQKSIYTSGKGTTSAGLTIGMVKLADGTMIAQAGVLPLCNNGYAYIDEFDKMNKDDRTAMHEAMEQQTVSIAKAGVNLTLDAKTSILAAANPKFGNYDDSLALMDNINIPSPLLSRFDLIWLIKDKVSQIEDKAKADHILDGFTNKEADKTCRFTERELTAFVNLAKKEQPVLDKGVRDEIIAIYQKLRQASNMQFTVGIRQLEALIRLSMAHAKLKFKPIVDIDDVTVIKELLISMYMNFDIDLKAGGTQSKLFTTGRASKEQTYHQIWAECADSNGKVDTTEFMKKLEERGVSNLDATKLFHRWENTNTIKLMADGTYKKTK